MRFDLRNPTNAASTGIRLWHRHRLAGQELVESLDQVGTSQLRLPIAGRGLDAILIVHAAAVADDSLLIKNEDLWRALGLQTVGDRVVAILQNRKRNAELARMRRSAVGDLGGCC